MVPKQRNPSRIQAQGATNSFADVVPNGSFETPKSKAKPMAWIECGMGALALFGWIGGMVPKQRNPSRIQAQGATNSFADVVPNGSFETPKSKAKPMAWIECGMGALALFGWIGGMVPKQRNPSRIQAQGATNSFADVVPNGSFETPKSKSKPMAYPTLYPRHRFCFAFRGFEAAVRHHVCERIRGPLGLNPAGVPLFRNHASNPTKQGQSSHPTLYPRHRF